MLKDRKMNKEVKRIIKARKEFEGAVQVIGNSLLEEYGWEYGAKKIANISFTSMDKMIVAIKKTAPFSDKEIISLIHALMDCFAFCYMPNIATNLDFIVNYEEPNKDEDLNTSVYLKDDKSFAIS